MGIAYDRVLDRLRDTGGLARANGTAATAKCPAHDDSKPSLGIREVPGRVLLFCHAGCETTEILETLGLTMPDLFDEPTGKRYTYEDLNGRPLRDVYRTPGKDFRQNIHRRTTKTPLFRLPQVAAAIEAGRVVWLVEGENDVEALESIGEVATTGPQGADSFAKVDVTPLEDATVRVVVDRDDAGRKWAESVVEKLPAVELVQARVGKDAADHITAGYGVDDFTPYTLERPLGELLKWVRADEVTPRRVVYAWEGRIPVGAITLIPGEEGIGKTTVGVRVMADLTRGTLPGEFYGKPRHVVVLSPEDGLEDVMRPRFEEAGADLTRVHFLQARIGVDDTDHDIVLPRDLHLIRRFIAEVTGGQTGLVWIDSLVTTLPDDLKAISYKDVATALKRISKWAELVRIAVAAPWHLNKQSGSDTAVRIMDSRAFRTAVRSMLLVVADPDAEDGISQGIVGLDKTNAGTLAVPAVRYRIRSAEYVVEELDEDTGELLTRVGSCGVAEWLGEVAGDGRDAVRAALIPEDRNNADKWLRAYLKEHGDSQLSDILEAAHNEERISRATLFRASKRIGVVVDEITGQDSNGRPFRRALWRLP